MWLSCSGARCVMTTKAMPVSAGRAEKKDWSAARAPAEPAIPTMVNPEPLSRGAPGPLAGRGRASAAFPSPVRPFFLAALEADFLIAIGLVGASSHLLIDRMTTQPVPNNIIPPGSEWCNMTRKFDDENAAVDLPPRCRDGLSCRFTALPGMRQRPGLPDA